LIEKHPELDLVKIKESDIGDQGLDALLSHPSMKVIQLGETQITGDNTQMEDGSVAASSLLEVLDLTEDFEQQKLTNRGLVMILNKVGVHLKKLVLGGRLIDNIGALAVHFPNLEVLILNKCMSLTDDGLLSILDITGSKLKVLDLSTTKISDFGSSTTTSLVNLEVLKLMYSPCDNPWMQNDRCLMNILNKTGNCLRSLNLSGNDCIRLGDTSYWAF